MVKVVVKPLQLNSIEECVLLLMFKHIRVFVFKVHCSTPLVVWASNFMIVTVKDHFILGDGFQTTQKRQFSLHDVQYDLEKLSIL